jgi:hypothetical protein
MPPSGLDVAKTGQKWATQKSSKEYRELSSLMCWDAVFCLAKLAGVISEKRYQSLKGNSAFLVSATDPSVTDAAAMRKVAAGDVLGFFEGEGSNSKMIHAMVATGSGKAVGNKNDCVGVGNFVGWEELDLAGGLNWSGSGIQAPKGVGVTRAVTVHHRPITRLS